MIYDLKPRLQQIYSIMLKIMTVFIYFIYRLIPNRTEATLSPQTVTLKLTSK